MSALGKRPGGPSKASRKRLLRPLAAVVATATASLALVTGFTGSASAAGTPVVTVAAAAPSLTAGRGATVPFVEQEAVNAATNGTVLPENRNWDTLAGEAVGRRAVTLSGQGKYVEFTLSQPANAIDLRYSIPDTGNGAAYTAPISVYLNGVKGKDLTLTNNYSWYYGGYPFSNNPGDGNPHHFYDEVHELLGQEMPAGATVRFQVDSEDTASSYTIDLADFEEVASPAAQPAGSLSVTSYGADPTGATDASSAFAAAISAGSAQGKIVWIPSGTFQVNSHIIVNNVTMEGAGAWYSVLTGNGVGVYGNPTPGSTNVHLSNFAIEGTINVRDDSAQVNGIGGAIGGGSTISGLWIEHTKVGMWFDGPFDGLTISDTRIDDTTADGINLHDGITHVTITNNFIRNTGDDGIATWADQNADANDTISFNTVEVPVLANNIAIYGGHDNSVTDNVVSDTQTQGGGIQVGNRFSSVALSGTTTIARNTTLRAGVLDPNWQFGVGAMWFYGLDSAMTGTINVSDTNLIDSDYEGIQFIGSGVSNVNFTNVNIEGAGTFALQLQSSGSATFKNVVATNIGGPAGTYNCEGSAFTVTDSGGNSGWNTSYCGNWPTPVYTYVYPPAAPGLTTTPSSLSFGSQNTGSTSAPQAITVKNAGNNAATVSSISTTGDFAQTDNCGSSIAAGASCTVNVTFSPTTSGSRIGTLTIASNAPGSPNTVGLSGTGVINGPVLGASPTSLAFGSQLVGTSTAAQQVTVTNSGTTAASISSIAASGDFSESNTCGTSLAVGASCTVSVTFSPTAAGARTGSVSIASNAFNSPTTIGLSGTGVSSSTNIALNQPITASGSTGGFPPANANDGNTSSYWESTDNAFPQWLQVDLGASTSTGKIVLDLPPSTAWGARTQTLTVSGSNDGSTFSTIVGSAGYTFDPSTGNTATINYPATSARYLRLTFTANTGWPAGQVSEFQVFPAGGSSPGTTVTASPSSLSFGSQTVGTTSAAQTVTVHNSGTSAAVVNAVTPTGDFAQTNTCGSSLAAGASCTVSVTFTPTTAGSRSGSVAISTNTPGSPATVALSGTGGSANTNLALNAPATASGTTQSYVPANAVDGNTSSYWESTDNAFPQWLQADLGSSTSVSKIVLDLPPSTAWATRTQTLSVLGSTDGSTFSTIVGSAGYTFDPSTGNTVTITFPATTTRYVRLNLTANTGWPAGQVSEFQIFH